MITLIGKDLAKKGNEFIFYGSVDECENCRFKASCVDSLEKIGNIKSLMFVTMNKSARFMLKYSYSSGS